LVFTIFFAFAIFLFFEGNNFGTVNYAPLRGCVNKTFSSFLQTSVGNIGIQKHFLLLKAIWSGFSKEDKSPSKESNRFSLEKATATVELELKDSPSNELTIDDLLEDIERVMKLFLVQCSVSCTALGGFISREIINSLTQQKEPLNNVIFLESREKLEILCACLGNETIREERRREEEGVEEVVIEID